MIDTQKVVTNLMKTKFEYLIAGKKSNTPAVDNSSILTVKKQVSASFMKKFNKSLTNVLGLDKV